MNAKRKKKSNRGRRSLPPGEALSARLTLRLKPAELAEIEAEALARGETKSDVMREAWLKRRR